MRRGKALTDFEKGRISALVDLKFSENEISELTDRTRNGVKHFIKKYKNNENFKKIETRGRKKTLNFEEKLKIKNYVEKNNFMTLKKIKTNLNLNISTSTIRRILNEFGYHQFRAVKKPLLSEKNRIDRLNWAKEHQNWSYKEWENILWSDETPVHFFNTRNYWVWRKEGERLDPKNVKKTVKHGGGKIMIWGCFHGKTMGKLIRIEGIMTSKSYVEDICDEYLFYYLQNNKNLTFQSDNDPKHRSKETKEAFQLEQVKEMIWPAQSPDLNPIENCWKVMKDELYDNYPNAKNADELFEFCEKIWKNMDKKYLKKLIMSMPNRCKEVIESNGNYTSYVIFFFFVPILYKILSDEK